MIAVLLLWTRAAAAAPPQRFSPLPDPCADERLGAEQDVVVCGRRHAVAPRLPLPRIRGAPDHPAPPIPR